MRLSNKYTCIVHVAAFVTTLLVAMLWSWNLLAQLFNGTHVQFKHALAAATLLLVAKWSIAARRRSHVRRCELHES